MLGFASLLPFAFACAPWTIPSKMGLGRRGTMSHGASGRMRFCFGSLLRAQERRCYTNAYKSHHPYSSAKKILCTQRYHPLPECLVWPDNSKQTASCDLLLIPNGNAPQIEWRRRKSSSGGNNVCFGWGPQEALLLLTSAYLPPLLTVIPEKLSSHHWNGCALRIRMLTIGFRLHK